MRTPIGLFCLLLVGCGGESGPVTFSERPKNTSVVVERTTRPERPAPPAEPKPKEFAQVTQAPAEPEVTPAAKGKRWEPKANEPNPQVAPAPSDDLSDLRTRKTGSDWPTFLGPTGNSISTEKGIISPWPKEGLRMVWTQRMGAG